MLFTFLTNYYIYSILCSMHTDMHVEGHMCGDDSLILPHSSED